MKNKTQQSSDPIRGEILAALSDIDREGTLWERTSSIGELRQTVRNMRDLARAALAKAAK